MSTTVAPAPPRYCCFGCRFAAGISADGGDRSLLGPASALGFSVFFTINAVMMTMALWSYADRPQTPFESALGHFLRYSAMGFSFPVLLLLGRPLVSQAWQGLRRGLLTTDLLLATGVLAAFIVSVFNTWRGQGHVYYEVGCVILVLVTLGRWLEATGRSRAAATLDELERLIPDRIWRWLPEGAQEVPRAEIRVGDRVWVRAGERIPLDGCVSRGRGIVDEQFFTGESTPVEKQPGATVLGGSLNLDGDLVIDVAAGAESGALSRLVAAVRAARLAKGRYQQLSDAWSQCVFPIIGVISVLATVYHGWRVDWEFGLLTGLSVVLIACPCALALATPLAVWTALGTAARSGVLFRSGLALETFAATRAIRWDKTGTLTTGTPTVEKLLCEQGADRGLIERYAAGLVRASQHAYSQAIRDYLTEVPANDQSLADWEIQTVAGRGLRATDASQQVLQLGSVRWMQEAGRQWGPVLSRALEQWGCGQDTNKDDLRRDQGLNPEPVNIQAAAPALTALSINQHVVALFVLQETLRPESATAIQRCQELGLDQQVLTGDRAARGTAVATELGLPVAAELLPEQKLAAIQTAHRQFGVVAMVGDGLNDAPALAGADLGIALGCGADITRDSADVCLLSTDLRLIPWAYDFAHQTVRIIRTNLMWSFGYNSLGVLWAAAGQLHPAVAAALMVVSSLMVLGNSLRLSVAPDESRRMEFLAGIANTIGGHGPAPDSAAASAPDVDAPAPSKGARQS